MAGHHDEPRFSWVHGISIILGIWLILSPILLPGEFPAPRTFWNDIIVGALIVIVSLVGIRSRSPLPNWAQVVLGMWLIVAPLALWQDSGNEAYDEILVGSIVAILGFIAAIWKQETRRRTPGA